MSNTFFNLAFLIFCVIVLGVWLGIPLFIVSLLNIPRNSLEFSDTYYCLVGIMSGVFILFSILSGIFFDGILFDEKKRKRRRTMKDVHTKYEVDETVFDNINEESAYWIGMLISDGHVDERSFRLTQNDIDHLNKFRKFMKTDIPISFYDQTPSVRVYRKRLAEKLHEYGLNKSNKTYSAAVNYLMFNRHFWRGVIDGDGSIMNTNRTTPEIRLLGPRDLLRQFAIFVKTIFPNEPVPRIVKRKNENIYRVSIYGYRALELMKILYEDANVYLDRKYERAMKAIEHYKNKVRYPKEA